MLAHRLRRWPNIENALDECPAFAGKAPSGGTPGLSCFVAFIMYAPHGERVDYW